MRVNLENHPREIFPIPSRGSSPRLGAAGFKDVACPKVNVRLFINLEHESPRPRQGARHPREGARDDRHPRIRRAQHAKARQGGGGVARHHLHLLQEPRRSDRQPLSRRAAEDGGGDARGLRPRDVVRRGAAPAVDQPRALLPGQPQADALHGADPLLAVLRAGGRAQESLHVRHAGVRREQHRPRRAGSRAGRGLLGDCVRAALSAGEVPHARSRPARLRPVHARGSDCQPHLELGARGARTLETSARQ